LNTEKLLSIGKRAEKAPVIIAEPLFYQEGAFEVNGRLTESLDKVALILKTEPQLILEINSHTDAKGTDAANLELSDKRAKAAAAYLVLERNISPSRVKGIGFGESKLINNCKDPAKCTEVENAANRRTEFIFSKRP
jgi:outer membrane protein OmpA-like peptidoglycan-associated protein